MQSQDRPQDYSSTSKPSTSPATPTPSPTSKGGFAGFFRRRRKSTSSNHDDSDVECMDGQDAAALLKSKTSPSDRAVMAQGKDSKDVYGNYATVSGTGANLMRDLFNRKYRGSNRLSSNYSSNENESRRKSSNQSGSNTSSIASLFKFRSKKDVIKEERSPSPTDEKTRRDISRSRHISMGSEAAAKKFVTPSASKLGSLMPSSGKVKGFFESFRQKIPRETTPEFSGPLSPQLTPPSILGPTIVYATGGKKKKKFKVTKAAEDDPSQFGPNNFLEMYRKNRAESEMKRLSRMHQLSSSPTFSKASTIHSYEPLHLVIWRDRKKGTRVFKLPKRYTDSLDFEEYHGEMVDSEELSVTRFANTHPCYDLMPASCKLVVFDVNLNVKKAFYALVNNGIRSAPLWSLEKHDFAGLLTVTDFLRILQKYHHSNELDMKNLENQKISNWKELLGDLNKSTMQVEPDTSLLAAAAILARHNLHHLPVVEQLSGNILFVLTSKRILRFITSYMKTLTREPGKDVIGNLFLQQTVEEANLGTFSDIATVTTDMTLIQAIDIFIQRNVSVLPIVNSNGQVIDVYSKSDVFSIADDQMYTNLNATIGEALTHRREESQHLQTCYSTERICDVIGRIVDTGVHCIMIVSDRKELKGVISITDVIDFLILRPFYKYRNQLAEKQRYLKRSSADMRKDSGEQDVGLPTLEELSPTDAQKQSHSIQETKRQSQVRFVIDTKPSEEDMGQVNDDNDVEGKSVESLNGMLGCDGDTVEVQNNVLCVGT